MWTCATCGRINPMTEHICESRHCDSLITVHVRDDATNGERLDLVQEFYERFVCRNRHMQSPFDIAFVNALDRLRRNWSEDV